MKRRALLQATAAAGVLLGGCIEGTDDPGGTGTATGDGSPTPTDVASPTGTEGGASGDDDGSGDDGEATDDGATETDAEGTDDGGPTETDTTSDEETPTGTDEGTATDDGGSGSNEIVDRSFDEGGSECGEGTDRAEVTRGDDRVDVAGTISGRNSCYTAELAEATYDDEADELTVAVRSYEDSDGGYCQQCIVDIDYRAAVEFRDGTPGEVTVVHNDEHVTTA